MKFKHLFLPAPITKPSTTQRLFTGVTTPHPHTPKLLNTETIFWRSRATNLYCKKFGLDIRPQIKFNLDTSRTNFDDWKPVSRAVLNDLLIHPRSVLFVYLLAGRSGASGIWGHVKLRSVVRFASRGASTTHTRASLNYWGNLICFRHRGPSPGRNMIGPHLYVTPRSKEIFFHISERESRYWWRFQICFVLNFTQIYISRKPNPMWVIETRWFTCFFAPCDFILGFVKMRACCDGTCFPPGVSFTHNLRNVRKNGLLSTSCLSGVRNGNVPSFYINLGNRGTEYKSKPECY